MSYSLFGDGIQMPGGSDFRVCRGHRARRPESHGVVMWREVEWTVDEARAVPIPARDEHVHPQHGQRANGAAGSAGA
jgi:hypothetical protein